MLYLFILLNVVIITSLIYNRYAPVRGISCIKIENALVNKKVVLVDLRDYNEAAKQPVFQALNIPSAYLKRYYHSIKDQDIIIITADEISKNTGIRFLRRKGCHVVAYSYAVKSEKRRINKSCLEGGIASGI
ncbi:sulfurtransferase [Aneurinibacillus sp. Ricciae_BoGa-3]|uniref:sulfurtransferase n=1 Tax=Aneurinibacillus sp. Ricciae_BoGa-3 TaxID=3022697 RepID=UPI0023425A5A|nr:sulfurtransferase [Aneurinibacillus sp. Ricciae_BoGa-3]WCK53905.1 sulfurtransferase [Aneurinibacillus sp. Ricciae_BoGa-3]